MKLIKNVTKKNINNKIKYSNYDIVCFTEKEKTILYYIQI